MSGFVLFAYLKQTQSLSFVSDGDCWTVCGVQFSSQHSLENSLNKSPATGGLQGISDTITLTTVF